MCASWHFQVLNCSGKSYKINIKNDGKIVLYLKMLYHNNILVQNDYTKLNNKSTYYNIFKIKS